jgi:hypothetical protein
MRTIGFIALIGLCLAIAGCPRVDDDALEPNDSPDQATMLSLDTPLTARAVQDNPDVFAIDIQVGGGTTLSELQFEFETLGGDECATFAVTAPDGVTLYRDTNPFCSRAFYNPEKVPAAMLDFRPGEGYTLTVPAQISGRYALTVNENGQVDNVFDYFWDYRLTATLTGTLE